MDVLAVDACTRQIYLILLLYFLLCSCVVFVLIVVSYPSYYGAFLKIILNIYNSDFCKRLYKLKGKKSCSTIAYDKRICSLQGHLLVMTVKYNFHLL